MAVEVRLFATLRRHAPANPNGVLAVDVPEGSTVLDVAKAINIDPNEIHLIMVNGTGCGFEQAISDGDRIGLFPPVGGG